MSSDFRPSSTPSLQPTELSARPPAPRSHHPSIAAAGALGALLGALLVVVWSEARSSGPVDASATQSFASEPQSDTHQAAIAGIGTVELDPAHVATITTQNSGVVMQLATFEGDHVEQGALLAVIEPDRSDVEVSRRRELPRDTYRLLSPIAGIVVEKALMLTQSVDSELLAFKIANLDHLRVDLRLDQPGARNVQPGDPVEVRPFAAHDVALPGRVVTVTPTSEATGAMLSVHVLDQHHHLRAGQSVRARVFVSGKPAATASL